jgi:hypothetical protein
MNNKTQKFFFLFLTASFLMAPSARLVRADDAEGPGGPPFPNDAGEAQLDVSKYPADIQADYRIFARRCSQCHNLARPLNSQFVQLTPEELAAAKQKEPDLFKDDKVWRISNSIWTDYVKTMQGKPGAIIRPSEFDKIVGFLVYDSNVRKTGANSESWRAARQKLLDDFKKSNPKRYAEIFGK